MDRRGDGPRRVDDALIELVAMRRLASFRALLTQGTGLADSITTMRVIRGIDTLRSAASRPSVGELAERLAMVPSNASRAVDVSVQQGLVLKEASTVDRRRIELDLTGAGEQAIADLEKRRETLLAEFMDDWSAEDVERLADLLERLRARYEQALSLT